MEDTGHGKIKDESINKDSTSHSKKTKIIVKR